MGHSSASVVLFRFKPFSQVLNKVHVLSMHDSIQFTFRNLQLGTWEITDEAAQLLKSVSSFAFERGAGYFEAARYAQTCIVPITGESQ